MFQDTRAFSSFSVNDLAQAKQFYSEILGLEVREEHEMLSLEINRGTSVMLYPKANHTPATFTVLNFLVINVAETVAELKKLGVQFEIYDQPDLKTNEEGIMNEGGQRIAWFKDPAGNILSVIEEQKLVGA